VISKLVDILLEDNIFNKPIQSRKEEENGEGI
jgi:hypothetical protein